MFQGRRLKWQLSAWHWRFSSLKFRFVNTHWHLSGWILGLRMSWRANCPQCDVTGIVNHRTWLCHTALALLTHILAQSRLTADATKRSEMRIRTRTQYQAGKRVYNITECTKWPRQNSDWRERISPWRITYHALTDTSRLNSENDDLHRLVARESFIEAKTGRRGLYDTGNIPLLKHSETTQKIHWNQIYSFQHPLRPQSKNFQTCTLLPNEKTKPIYCLSIIPSSIINIHQNHTTIPSYLISYPTINPIYPSLSFNTALCPSSSNSTAS